MSSDYDVDWDVIPDSAPVKFDSAEHADIPSECYLRFTADPNEKPLSGKAEGGRKLATTEKKMKKKLTFAEVIALGGDFYVNRPGGDLTRVISYGKTFEERRNRFNGAVDDISQDPDNAIELLTTKYLAPEVAGIESILASLDFEPDQAKPAQPQPTQPDPAKPPQPQPTQPDPASAAKAAETKLTKEPVKALGVNEIVYNYKNEIKEGGVSSIKEQAAMTVGKEGLLASVTSHYSSILIYNMDHFHNYAWDAYRAGHSRALEIAMKGWADGKHDEAKLGEAYLYDSFALHYLSDQFSSGHSRTARMEFSHPAWTTTFLPVFKGGLESVGLNGIAPYKTAWDNATNLLHDIDNATGIRVANLNGDQWIAYGDAQYFIESNRINRLKSIECVQSSIDEVYKTWLTGKLPEGCAIKTGNGLTFVEKFNYEAMKIAPIPAAGRGPDDNTESNGNPSQLWVVVRDDSEPNPQKMLEDKISVSRFHDPLNRGSGKYPPDHSRVSGSKCSGYLGYWYARRKWPEECSVAEYVWGYPGLQMFPLPKVHADVAAVEGTNFYQNDRLREEARAVEILSGGFLQVSEYRTNEDLGKMNYAVNAWGPVQVPIVYVSSKTLSEKEGKQRDFGERLQNRQMTFTFRGRTPKLKKDSETLADSKTFRWVSWFDPAGSGKTVLLRFYLSLKDIGSQKKEAIMVDSWSFIDKDKNMDQQWTNFENIRPDNRVEFAGPDKENPKVEIDKFVLVDNFPLRDWTLWARLTRFFIFPFRKGSSKEQPDLVTFTWTSSGGFQPMIRVASTKNSLSTAAVTMKSTVDFKEGQGLPLYGGFIKRFEDENNKGMILYAKATKADGVTILPTVFEQKGDTDEILQTSGALQTPGMMASDNKDFYQILVGDTRKCGHQELVAMTGTWPNYYLNAWELTAGRIWQKTSGDGTRAVQASSSSKSPPDDQLKTLRHLFCTLIPNEHTESKGNGLNVLLVSSYGEYNQFINFRTFIKLGAKPDSNVQEGSKPGDKSAAQQPTVSPQIIPPAPPASSYTWVIVNWGSGVSSLVPSWCFTPPEQQILSGVAKLVHPSSEDTLKGGAAGRNSWATYDQWGSISSSFGDDDRALFASKPVPGLAARNINDPSKEAVVDMSIAEGSGFTPGSVVPLPLPYLPRPSTGGAITEFDETSFLSGCGRYQAIEQDVSRLQPIAIVKDYRNGSMWLYKPNGVDMILEQWTSPAGKLAPDDIAYNFNDRVAVDNDWRKVVETEYYFDTVTNKPTAAMFVRGRLARYRILNPDFLFKRSAKPPPPKSSLPAPTPAAPLPMEPPINKISTAPPPVIKQSRPAADWSQYVDYPVADNFGAHNNFHSMGWRLCKVASTVRKGSQYGVMQIFSFHGVIGVRVWAPRETGEYGLWVPRGMNPYLGQTSLGTGYDSLGRWNDNASTLSFGSTEDFQDINYWDAGTKSWSEPTQMMGQADQKGFEAKWPTGTNPEARSQSYPPGMTAMGIFS